MPDAQPNPSVPYIETSLSPDSLAEKLRAYAPWRHEFTFSTGQKTSDFGQAQPWTPGPWNKMNVLEPHLPWADLRHALDVGCNSGQSALYLATRHDMTGLGIDVVPRHVEVSTLMLTLAEREGWSFQRGDANYFVQPDAFDLVLHFGTLYHLRHPMLSLENAFSSLRSGGWLALETQIYTGGSDAECYYGHGLNGDRTNWWMPSLFALEDMLKTIGFTSLKCVYNGAHPFVQDHARTLHVAKKP